MNQKKRIGVLDPQLVHLNVEVDSKEELLTFMSNELMKQGVVRSSFLPAVIAREASYPTGLMTTSIPVAIPHTNREHVLESTISFASLKHPVTFTMMGTTDDSIEVEAVFMLAIDSNEGQLDMLKNIMGLLVNEQILTSLKNALHRDEVIELLEQQLYTQVA